MTKLPTNASIGSRGAAPFRKNSAPTANPTPIAGHPGQAQRIIPLVIAMMKATLVQM
jgi:hypothetical protein